VQRGRPDGRSHFLHVQRHAGFEYKEANKLGALINLDDISHIPFLEASLGGKLPESSAAAITRAR